MVEALLFSKAEKHFDGYVRVVLEYAERSGRNLHQRYELDMENQRNRILFRFVLTYWSQIMDQVNSPLAYRFNQTWLLEYDDISAADLVINNNRFRIPNNQGWIRAADNHAFIEYVRVAHFEYVRQPKFFNKRQIHQDDKWKQIRYNKLSSVIANIRRKFITFCQEEYGYSLSNIKNLCVQLYLDRTNTEAVTEFIKLFELDNQYHFDLNW